MNGWWISLAAAMLLAGSMCWRVASGGPPPASSAPLLHEDFEKARPGHLPPGWKAATTHKARSTASWNVTEDPEAPSPPHMLTLTRTENTGSAYNLCLYEKAEFQDLDVSVKLRANVGKEDQGGGLVWRCKDENNYLICRINPLEKNFRLYKVVAGERKQLDSADVALVRGKWYTLRVVCVGEHITCYLDGKMLLEATDPAILDKGMIGLWTKADAASSFDDLEVRAATLRAAASSQAAP